MTEIDYLSHLLSQRYFPEAAYFAVVLSLRNPSAPAHMLAGAACCGCCEPLAKAQKLLDGVEVPDEELGTGALRVSPITLLPYEGFFHLLQALRMDPSITAPANLREVFDSVADDLSYVSRRELELPPDQHKRYSLRMASVAAALLLRRFTGSTRELPGVMPTTITLATEIIDAELSQAGGDAAFLEVNGPAGGCR
jgi:hypothetical protein